MKLQSLVLSCFCVIGFALGSPLVWAETRELDIVAIEVNKTKYWLPTEVVPGGGLEFSLKNGMTLTVKKGDTVIIHPKSLIEGANNIHGFSITELKVSALVDGKGIVKSKETQETAVRFTADQAGDFKIFCHLHPAHVGGWLKVTQ